MATFSWRAECEHDMLTFVHTLKAKGVPYEISVSDLPLDCPEGPRAMGDMKAELKIDMTLREVRLAMAEQIDAHVMIQSLRELPLGENHLGRDHSIDWWKLDTF